MKRYSLIVALHIIGIAFLSVGVYLLVDAGLWFSALMAFLILLAIAVHLYRLQMMQVRMMRHLAESLRYDDMMLSFRSPYKNRSMEDMVDELSEAMRNFRTRVLERNEMEAWQKLIRVLTHEIMNSITPIISLSETLSEREMSEKNYPVMRQGMQTIHRRSKGLLEFVENYRKLTRLPAPVRRPVAVRELLQDLQKLFSEEYIRIELPEADRILQIDRTQIERRDGKVMFKEGDTWTAIDDNAPVSMNMWGFTPDYFKYSEEYFVKFLKENADNIKAEYFIPLLVNDLIQTGKASVTVLDTPSKWFGVTYAADRQSVVDKIHALIAAGEYPEKLF